MMTAISTFVLPSSFLAIARCDTDASFCIAGIPDGLIHLEDQSAQK
jgi:hypothetical protein